MAEYIEKEAAITVLLNDAPEQVSYSREDAADCIRYMDAADVAPVRHGRWLQKKHKIFGNAYDYVCSECGCDYALAEYNYCPNCGCKMDLEEEQHELRRDL